MKANLRERHARRSVADDQLRREARREVLDGLQCLEDVYDRYTNLAGDSVPNATDGSCGPQAGDRPAPGLLLSQTWKRDRSNEPMSQSPLRAGLPFQA